MKKMLYLLALLLTAGTATLSGQTVSLVNGVYVDASGNPYSGEQKTWYADGKIKAAYTIANGVLNGPAVLYAANGSKMEAGSYTEGQRDGIWESWNEQGQKTGEASFIKGVKHGRWLVWDANGTKRAEMHYTHGKKSDTWTMWNENGEVTSQKTYLPEQ